MRYAVAGALVVSLAGAAWGQESPDKASERMEIKQPLDTWYRIEQGTSRHDREHRGWARERVTPVDVQPWKYEYSYESGGIYVHTNDAGETAMREVKERITAKLDGSFDIMSLDAELEVDKRKARVEVRQTESGRTAEITSLDGRARKITEAGDAPVMYTLALALLRERQRGELRKPGTREMVLVDAAYEYDDVKVRRDVKAEGRLKVDVNRRVPVIPVEFRPGRSDESAKPVVTALLDRYGRIVEVIGDTESAVRTMATDEKEAKGSEGIELKGRGDPFDRKLTKKGEEKQPDKEPDQERRRTPKELEKLLREIERRAENVMKAAKGDQALADDLYEDFYKAYVVARQQAESDPVTQGLMDTYYADAHLSVGSWDHELRLGERCLAKIKAAAEQYEEADAKAAFEPLKALPGRVPGGREPAPKLEKMIADARGHIDAIAARRELRKMTLVLTGTSTKEHAVRVPVEYTICIFSSEQRIKTSVQMWIRDEWAIVNDNVYRVGEEVAGAGVKVEKITQWGVTVSYKGATREIALPK